MTSNATGTFVFMNIDTLFKLSPLYTYICILSFQGKRMLQLHISIDNSQLLAYQYLHVHVLYNNTKSNKHTYHTIKQIYKSDTHISQRHLMYQTDTYMYIAHLH